MIFYFFINKKYKFQKRKSLVLEEDDNLSSSGQPQPIKLVAAATSPNNCKQVATSVISAKKLFDHSNYWKIVAQDYAKKLDDSAREKDIHKEQASGY